MTTTETPRPSVPPRFPELHDPAWVAHHYVERRLSIHAIGRLLGCSHEAVRLALIAYGIPRRPAGSHATAPAELDDRDWLIEHYVTRQEPLTAIARGLGVASRRVREALVAEGVTLRPRGRHPRQVVPHVIHFPQLHDADWLRAEYEHGGRTQIDLARQLGCTPKAVADALLRNGIPIRPRGRSAA